MSQMMGEGYRDPRFIATTGNLLIDKWGLHPFAPDTSGQVLSAKQMGIEDLNIGVEPNLDTRTGLGTFITGAYQPNTDIMRWQSATHEADPRYDSPEKIQTHEIIHRAAKRSGWDDKKWSRLKESVPLKYKLWIYDDKNDEFNKIFEPFFDEAMAETLAHTSQGGKISDQELQNRIKFRVRSTLQKEEHEPDGLAEREIPELVPYLIKDFESYLQQLEDNREGFAEGGKSLLERDKLESFTELANSLLKRREMERKKRKDRSSKIKDWARKNQKGISNFTREVPSQPNYLRQGRSTPYPTDETIPEQGIKLKPDDRELGPNDLGVWLSREDAEGSGYKYFNKETRELYKYDPSKP